jgi:hypothetical protein
MQEKVDFARNAPERIAPLRRTLGLVCPDGQAKGGQQPDTK